MYQLTKEVNMSQIPSESGSVRTVEPPADDTLAYEKARSDRTVNLTIWLGAAIAVAFASVIGYLFTMVD